MADRRRLFGPAQVESAVHSRHAESLRCWTARRVSTSNSIGLALNLIPAGEILTGSPDDTVEVSSDEKS